LDAGPSVDQECARRPGDAAEGACGEKSSLAASELLAIIEEAVGQPAQLTPREVLAEVRRLGLQTPAEAVAMIRASRDGR
jgi:hypothetical protein